MTFSEFAQMLGLFFGAANGVADYMVTLVDNIMEVPPNEADEKKSADGKYNPLAELESNTLEAYYNGKRQLPKSRAAQIIRHLDKAHFEEYVDALPMDTLNNLCAECNQHGLSATTQETSKICADTFEQILLNIGKTNTKLPGQLKIADVAPLRSIHMVEFSHELAPSVAEISEYQSGLFIETKGYCPNDGCSEPLFINTNGKKHERYTVTAIDITKPLNTFGNLIALCPKCSDAYGLSRSPEEVQRMAEIKRSLGSETSALEALSEIKIEEEISEVLSSIATAPEDKLVPLNYEPVMVVQKIDRANNLLLRKTMFNVTTYFNYVKDVFQQLSKEGKLRFDTVAVEIKLSYLKAQNGGLSQQDTYDALVEWLRTNTNGSRDACDVVISYFVQNCEVFDAIAE